MRFAGGQSVEPAPDHRKPRWLLAILAAMATGALMAACYRPLTLHFLAWIALIPWLVVLPKLSPAKAWLFGIVLGLVFYRIGLDWLLKLAGPIGGATVVVLSVWMGFAFRVARILMDKFGRASMLWAVPMAFTGAEILRCEGLPQLRFAFLGFGYSQSHNLWFAQIASIGGVYSLSLLVVAFNTAVAYALLEHRRRAWTPALGVAGSILVLGFISQPGQNLSGRTVTVACVQGEELRYREYLALAAQAAAASFAPDFIVLPEHTIDEMASERHELVSGLTKLASTHGVYSCVGAHVPAWRNADCHYDNVAMLIGPPGGIVGTQAKAVPLPFFQDGNPARSQVTFETDRGRVGMYVCYDGHFTDHPRRLAALGAELMLVPVMDPVRWPEQELWQHADMAPLRSIELRRSTVRAASSGISQIIDPAGWIVASRKREEGPGIISAMVPMSSVRSPFVKAGYLFATATGLAFLAAIAILTLAQWTAGLRKLCTRSANPS